MAYHVETGWGGGYDNPSLEQMTAILASPNMDDVEHGGAWLTHDSEWTLSVEGRALVIWSGPDREARHMKGLSHAHVLRLWCKLAAGKIAEIESEPWQPGNGATPLTAAQQTELDAIERKRDRDFYDSLGVERIGTRCQQCERGTVVASVFCRAHHFEAIKRKRCPFSD